MYRCVTETIEGFVQQLACRYVAQGYYFYVLGSIPERKNPAAVDAKLVRGYGLEISKWARARGKKAGRASLQYLRFGHTFVLIATHGDHVFFRRETGIKDIREAPIRFHGYSIGCGRGVDGKFHASVRIHQAKYRELKAYFLDRATRRTMEVLADEFRSLPFEPYARVRLQYLKLLKHTNAARRVAGLEPVLAKALRFRRRIVRPFGDGELSRAAARSTEQLKLPVGLVL